LNKPQLAPQEVFESEAGNLATRRNVFFVGQTQQVQTHRFVHIKFVVVAVTYFSVV
jgi:hypothetical protein